MINRLGVRTILAIFAIALVAGAQTPADTLSKFKIRPDGVIDVGPLFFEVNYYDSDWTISQQHDKFQLAPTDKAAPATQPAEPAGGRTFTGVLTTAQGPATLTEKVVPAENGLDYSCAFTSDKDLPTNEISVAFLLPTTSFAGKEVTIDGDATQLPSDPAKKGESQILAKDEVHEVSLPLLTGTLSIKGNFKVLIQDDREWGDPRYSMRLMFSPNSGTIKESKIDLQMRLKSDSK